MKAGWLSVGAGMIALAFVGEALLAARWWMTNGSCMLDGPGACADVVMDEITRAWWSFIVAIVFLAVGLAMLAKSPHTIEEGA